MHKCIKGTEILFSDCTQKEIEIFEKLIEESDREAIAIEQFRFDWTMHIDGPIFYKEEYLNNRNLSDLFVDQAPSYNIGISSFFTQFGLKRMESWMIKQIMNGTEFTKKELSRMIKRNPHLHNVIKTNLLLNLKNYER